MTDTAQERDWKAEYEAWHSIAYDMTLILVEAIPDFTYEGDERELAREAARRLLARQREERLPDDDQVPVRRAYDGWSVYDEESLNWASESCEEAADQLGWKEHELDSLRVAGEAIKELLWRREQMKFMKRDLRNLRDATPQREGEREPVAWLVRAWHPEHGWHENVHVDEKDADVTFRWYSGHPIMEEFERVSKTPLYTEPPAEPDLDELTPRCPACRETMHDCECNPYMDTEESDGR